MTQESETASRQGGQTAVSIIGMHRSGTLLRASLVHALGISVGERLHFADIHNLSGYFEDQDWVSIQERMLKASG